MSIIRITALTILFSLLAILPNQPTHATTPNATEQFSCANVTEIPQSECEALVALYNGTDGPNWRDTTGWLVTNTPCSWYGVACHGENVDQLALAGAISDPFGLNGDLPAEIGNLNSLTGLYFPYNDITDIPAEIGNLTNLTNLDLGANQLSSIPTSIGNLQKLNKLSLSGNQLSSIPAEIGNLNNLTELWLLVNQLSSIPAEIGNLNNLRELWLYSNQLTSLPPEIGNLNNLTQLLLYSNQLTSLPPEISNLNNLTALSLSTNQLSKIPIEFSTLNNLMTLDLAYNKLVISDSDLRSFITLKDPDWYDTQTVSPTTLKATAIGADSIELTWNPIAFQTKDGYYEISVSDGGSFTVHNTTASKSINRYVVNGLSNKTTYNIRIRTYTPTHDGAPDGLWNDQHNELWSDYSESVSATTWDPPTPTPTNTSTNTPTVTDTATLTHTPTSTPTNTSVPTSTPTQTTIDTPTQPPTFTPIPTYTPTSPPTFTPTLTFTPRPPPTFTSTPTATKKPTPTSTPICYLLTLNKNGSGQPPTASPVHSTDCPVNHYQFGEFIQLNARPASGWQTEGWRGTDDNSRKTNFNTLKMPATAHQVTAIYSQIPPSLPIEPLAVACRDMTPSGPALSTACLVGMVYVNGVPRADVEVKISSDSGKEATVRTFERNFGSEARPHYRFNLSDYPLRLEPGQAITLRATYNGVEEELTWVVQPGRQQLDIVFATGETRPIATINYLSEKNFVQGDELRADGMGQIQQEGGEIEAYLWESDKDGLLGEGATLTYLISELSDGTHQLSFKVQDDQGIWSAPVIEDIHVAKASQVDWLVLLYLAGDYSDGNKQWDVFQDVLKQLRHSVDNPEIRIVAQVDGYEKAAQRWVIEPGDQVQAARLLQESIGEVSMDDPETLADFLRWGQGKYPAQHYYLVIADHGQGVQGIAWDTTSDLGDDGIPNGSAYLTNSELGQALDAPNVAPVDVLHLDACSMGMLEVAYEVSNRTQVLVFSQYLGWDYFVYDQYVGLIESDTTPAQLGRGIVETYSNVLDEDGPDYPYTISALDMQRSVVTVDALDTLAAELAERIRKGDIKIDPFQKVRAAVQTFDSQGDSQNDPDDLYIDLKDWVVKLREELGESNATIDEMAAALADELDRFVLASQADSGRAEGQDVDLDNAGGLSIFYPLSPHHETHQRYVAHQLFKFTRHSRWASFLHAERGNTTPGIAMTPAPGPLGYLQRTAVQEPDTPTPTLAPTMTPTMIPTPTWTVTPSPTPTASPSATPTATFTLTPIPTRTPTLTPTYTPTTMPTATPIAIVPPPGDEQLYLPIIKK